MIPELRLEVIPRNVTILYLCSTQPKTTAINAKNSYSKPLWPKLPAPSVAKQKKKYPL